ncbi:hypothetical protein Btru_033385 [Bulinus truncatus]|nr:hypothetical protein Btru_033385 [Bulinus truncatus]
MMGVMIGGDDDGDDGGDDGGDEGDDGGDDEGDDEGDDWDDEGDDGGDEGDDGGDDEGDDGGDDGGDEGDDGGDDEGDEVNNRNAGVDWNGTRDDLNNNPNKSSNMSGNNSFPIVPDQASIGFLHLSFEYSKLNLKIRVWQVSDLLMPPPQTSMIESLYVKSYFVPDTANKSNRKTEDVRVEPAIKDGNNSHGRQNSIQHIFSSSAFRFETPLLYTGVTQEMVTERSVQLDVCMIQKHTGKSFLMGMVHLPLRTAVRRPVREKYPLIPCMNHTTPNSMKVYSARDIISVGTNSEFQTNHRASFSGKSSDKVNAFVQRFSSLNLSDSDDEGVGGSFGMISIPGISSFDDVADSNDEEVENSFRNTHEQNMSPSSPCSDDADSFQTRVKKKIIPNEFLSRSVSSESYDEYENGKVVRRVSGKFTVVKVDEPLVEMPNILNDSQEIDHTNQTAGVKKKIIPNELHTEHGTINKCDPEDVKNSSKSSPSFSTIDQTNNHLSTNGKNNIEKKEIPDQKFRLSVKSNSEMVSDVASTPGSRPETPVWDFYDFTVEEAGNIPSETSKDSALSRDEASEALGTLQASIQRLSRNPQVLDTCRVTGPVLPTVMIDDFEMEDDENILENIDTHSSNINTGT